MYTPDREYLSCARSWCVSRMANVYVVRNVILRSVRLKMFVMYKVSLPMYVKQAQILCGVGGYLFVRVEVWGFVRVYWKGSIV